MCPAIYADATEFEHSVIMNSAILFSYFIRSKRKFAYV